MPTAYVLLNTEIGAENQVLKALKKIEGVEEAYNLYGVYDIIVNIKVGNIEKFKYLITKRIGRIGKINSKLTIIITEKPQPTLEEQTFFEQNPVENSLVL